MAAEALGLPPFTIAELVEELAWPDRRVDVGLVETAGGVRSPQAADGDSLDLVRELRPDLVVLVADAGLGTINAVRLSLDALLPAVGEVEAALAADGRRSIPVVVVLDRFQEPDEIHQRNLQWLASNTDVEIFTIPGQESSLGDFVLLHR
jgi:dethiobiotin synthetase